MAELTEQGHVSVGWDFADEAALARDGFCLVRDVIDAEEIAKVIRVAETTAADEGRGGVRNLLDVPEFRAFAGSVQVRKLVDAALGKGAFAVRGILFDKTDSANWKVPWHLKRFDLSGCNLTGCDLEYANL